MANTSVCYYGNNYSIPSKEVDLMNKNKKLIIIILLLVAVLSMVTLLYTYAKFTTRVTGCCDSIVDNITGLFADNDASDIAKKIDMIRLNHAIDGNAGRRWVVENFDSPLIWKEIEEKLYKS